ncbi:MAG TPA: hypothetical protein PK965_10690 [Anaerohalosphaeraceae bacterium]|nr:hypothetical protein [Anaerohalosphaeraceae bacterium]
MDTDLQRDSFTTDYTDYTDYFTMDGHLPRRAQHGGRITRIA